MKRTVTNACLRIAVMLLATAGCSRQTAADRPPQDAGAPPRRVVCGSPAVTEIVFALGCGDRVVGVSDYCTYPPEAAMRVHIGGWINPSREKLLVLEPDLILSQGNHASLAAFANEYGIAFESVSLDSAEDIFAAIEQLAAGLGSAALAEPLIASIRADLEAVRTRVQAYDRKRVLFLLGRTPGDLTGLTTIGASGFLSDMIEIAGGTNVFADAMGLYPQVSKESLVVRRPDVILEANPGSMNADAAAHLRADWQQLPELPAVQNGNLFVLTDDYILNPGPRVGLTAMRFARIFHPEAFSE